MVPLPAFIGSGTKRTRSVERRSSAELFATAPTAVQLEPPSTENCQVPFACAVVVIAIPFRAPASGSVTVPMTDETSCPAVAVWSSVIVVKLAAAAFQTGAVLAAGRVKG